MVCVNYIDVFGINFFVYVYKEYLKFGICFFLLGLFERVYVIMKYLVVFDVILKDDVFLDLVDVMVFVEEFVVQLFELV